MGWLVVQQSIGNVRIARIALEIRRQTLNRTFVQRGLIMATVKELREMSNEQMDAVLKEACQQLFRLKIQAQTERLDVPSEMKRYRRLIARIKTLQTERSLAAPAAETATA